MIGHAISRMGHIFRILKLHNAISRLHIFLNYTENIFAYCSGEIFDLGKDV